MHRHRTRGADPTAPTIAVAHDTPAALRDLVVGARFRIGDSATLLVNDKAVDIEIAEAAWRILKKTGGLLDRPAIGQRYGLSRQRTYELTNNKSFPAPVDEISGRPLWLTLHIDRYRERSRPGRPRREPNETPPDDE